MHLCFICGAVVLKPKIISCAPHHLCCKSAPSLLTTTQKQSSSDLGSVATCVLLVGGPTASHTRSVTKTITFLSNWHLLMSSVSLSISISPPTESAHMSTSECLFLTTHNQLGQMGDKGVISYVRNVNKLLFLLVLKSWTKNV